MYLRLFAVFVVLVAATFASAQSPSMKRSYVSGDVISITAAAIALKTKDGEVAVSLSEKTEFKRVAPEKLSFAKASPSNLGEISVGDRLMVSGVLAEDNKSISALTVYLMKSTDISQQKQADAQKWATRGISGRVASANATTGQLSIDVRGLTGTQTVIVTPKSGAKFRKYKQDSIQYSEALESTFADVHAGDMIRALGDRSTDGLSFSAEEIVTGAFKTVIGKVKSVDAATGQIVITELQANKDVTVAVGSGSMLKKIPDEMLQRFGQTPQPGGPQQSGAGAAKPGTATPPSNGEPKDQTSGSAPGAGPGLGGTRGGIDDMFERFQTIKSGDLKVGEMIAVSSSKNGADDKITAIKLLAGVEPFVRMAQAQNAGGARGRSGQPGGFSIPGLDGFNF